MRKNHGLFLWHHLYIPALYPGYLMYELSGYAEIHSYEMAQDIALLRLSKAFLLHYRKNYRTSVLEKKQNTTSDLLLPLRSWCIVKIEKRV